MDVSPAPIIIYLCAGFVYFLVKIIFRWLFKIKDDAFIQVRGSSDREILRKMGQEVTDKARLVGGL